MKNNTRITQRSTVCATVLLWLAGCAGQADMATHLDAEPDCTGAMKTIELQVSFDADNCPQMPVPTNGADGCKPGHVPPAGKPAPVCLCARGGNNADRLAWTRLGDGPEFGVFFSPFGPPMGSPSGGNSGRLRSVNGRIGAAVAPVVGKSHKADGEPVVLAYEYVLVSLGRGAENCEPIDPPVIIEQ